MTTVQSSSRKAMFAIKSRKHGEVCFSVYADGGYVRVSMDGATDRQIGEDGSFSGNMLTANEDTLERTARRWWRDFLADEREMGL